MRVFADRLVSWVRGFRGWMGDWGGLVWRGWMGDLEGREQSIGVLDEGGEVWVTGEG